jgi:uncharacterized protein YjbI with pentapeptide repeats
MLKNLYGEKRTPRTQDELNAILSAHEKYAKFLGGARAQLAHAQLDGLTLANRNLPEADFSGASLVGANLYGSNLERASLYCADLRDCDLQSAKLARADLRGASFKGAKLSFAVLDRADLRAAMMMYVGPEGISVVDRERQNSEGRVDFSNCSMKGVSFGNAKLDGADFTGALLQGANFRNAKLANVTFRDAVLTGVNLKEIDAPAEAFAGAVADISPQAAGRYDELKAMLDAHQLWLSSGGDRGAPANFDGEDLRPLQKLFVGRSLGGISARKAVCIGVDFTGARLHAAKFDGADLRDADFSNADLRGVSFRGAKLAHAKFERANLTSLPLASGASLSVDLTDAAATADQFHRALLESSLAALGLSAAGQAPGPR